MHSKYLQFCVYARANTSRRRIIIRHNRFTTHSFMYIICESLNTICCVDSFAFLYYLRAERGICEYLAYLTFIYVLYPYILIEIYLTRIYLTWVYVLHNIYSFRISQEKQLISSYILAERVAYILGYMRRIKYLSRHILAI